MQLKGAESPAPLILCRGDLTRTDDPHALRDALIRLNIIVFKKSFGTSLFNDLF